MPVCDLMGRHATQKRCGNCRWCSTVGRNGICKHAGYDAVADAIWNAGHDVKCGKWVADDGVVLAVKAAEVCDADAP